MFDLEKTEKSVMNLFGLITAIRASAENLSRDEGGERLDKHIECVTELCDISTEKLKDVWEAISEIENDEMPVRIDAESEIGFENKTYRTAEMISFLITDESVPDKISDALGDAIADLSNPLCDDSPEYIARVLEYQKDDE